LTHRMCGTVPTYKFLIHPLVKFSQNVITKPVKR
jgi:hypothetical protein